MNTVYTYLGMITITHSGGQSVVGNSKVEEHLSKEAQSAVFDRQQHSQEPANYASNKLEVWCVCVRTHLMRVYE